MKMQHSQSLKIYVLPAKQQVYRQMKKQTTKELVERGLEPRTLGLLDPCSNQLSYTTVLEIVYMSYRKHKTTVHLKIIFAHSGTVLPFQFAFDNSNKF
jgi:hypothetical protein